VGFLSYGIAPEAAEIMLSLAQHHGDTKPNKNEDIADINVSRSGDTEMISNSILCHHPPAIDSQ
jgi:hypothetical protein